MREGAGGALSPRSDVWAACQQLMLAHQKEEPTTGQRNAGSVGEGTKPPSLHGKPSQAGGASGPRATSPRDSRALSALGPICLHLSGEQGDHVVTSISFSEKGD